MQWQHCNPGKRVEPTECQWLNSSPEVLHSQGCLRDSSLPRPYQGKTAWGGTPLTALVLQRICKFNIQGWVWPTENTQIQPVMTRVQFKTCHLPYYANTLFSCCKQAVQRGFPGVHVKHFPTSTTATTCELLIHPTSLHGFNDRTTDSLSQVWFSTSQMKRIVSKPILPECYTSAWLLLEDLPYQSCPDTILQASDKTSLWCQDRSRHGLQVSEVHCSRSQCLKKNKSSDTHYATSILSLSLNAVFALFL